MENQTRKSHKSVKRDKFKHSKSNTTTAAKGGAGGKYTWGAPDGKDELLVAQAQDYALDKNDPNYDPAEAGDYKLVPADNAQAAFRSSAAMLARYKRAVRDAVSDFVTNGDVGEFERVVRELDQPIYHGHIAKIAIRTALAHPPQDREKISSVLAHLVKRDLVTAAQITQGFRKLYNTLDDMVLDLPRAGELLAEFADHAVSNDMLAPAVAKEMRDGVEFQSDAKQARQAKDKIRTLVLEYFDSEELAECVRSLGELDLPVMHFEVVKQLVSLSLDRGPRERRLVSELLAEAVGTGAVARPQAEKAFEVLLERVEDILLDVPNVLELLSLFIARAVVDEALPPAFMLRVDLQENDMGYQVVRQARSLLEPKGATTMLSQVWEERQRTEDEARRKKTEAKAEA